MLLVSHNLELPSIPFLLTSFVLHVIYMPFGNFDDRAGDKSDRCNSRMS